MQQPPERIVIDTSLPTIVPPPTRFADAVPDQPPPPVQSYVSAPPRPIAIDVDKKRSKAIKRQVKELAAKQTPVSGTAAVVGAAAATTVPPTRLSFANILSGQLVRDLFNLR
jgi:negative regulator of sigma E activity